MLYIEAWVVRNLCAEENVRLKDSGQRDINVSLSRQL
jgi:hypothetical protein